MMRPRLNRRGCAVFVIFLLVVALALLVIIDRGGPLKPDVDTGVLMQGPRPADAPRL